MEFQLSYFKSWKMMLWKCCIQYANMLARWKTQQWPQDWKRSVFIPIPKKKGNAQECSNYCTIALISHASKVMLKILQARLQQYVNCEFPDVQAGFRKGGGTRDQIANICWIIKKAKSCSKFSKIGFNSMWTKNFEMFKLVLEKAEEPEIKLPTSVGSSKKQESSRKASTSALLTMPKPLTVWITTNCGKFLKRWEYQSSWPASWEICMQVKKQQLEPHMKQIALVAHWFQIGRGVHQGCILYPA